MSLMATRQSSGPTVTTAMISPSTTMLTNASRCLRKRRHASRPGEVRRFGAASAGPASRAASTISDAGVEPAIQQIGDEVEQDDEGGEDEGDAHHDGGVVGEDRGDQQRADAGDAEDLFGDDGAAEDDRHLQGDEGDDGDHRVADDVAGHDAAAARPPPAPGGG